MWAAIPGSHIRDGCRTARGTEVMDAAAAVVVEGCFCVEGSTQNCLLVDISPRAACSANLTVPNAGGSEAGVSSGFAGLL